MVKQAALFSTLETFLRQGIIRTSNVAHYSQVLLVPKQDDFSCMCVDYRASWPKPNIAGMDRVNQNFGIMDLTRGYHYGRMLVIHEVEMQRSPKIKIDCVL